MANATTTQGGIPSPDAMHSLLTGLPTPILLLVLQQLDVVSLCSVARCSRVLQRLSGHATLWPASPSHAAGDWALSDVRTTLAHILRLPPQVFNAQLDVRRSRRFPVSVSMHNLRTILATSDTEGLADRVSRALQDRVAHAQHNMWRFDSWQELPPAASISICRADGAVLRAALRPLAVVPRLVHHLQQAGWPKSSQPTGKTTPAGSSVSCSDVSTSRDSAHDQPRSATGSAQYAVACSGLSSSSSSGTGPVCSAEGCLPAGLLSVLQLCQQRMGLLRSGQLLRLQHLRRGADQGAAGAKGQGVQQSGVKGAGWRPNKAALQTVAPKLPDEATARDYVSRIISTSAGGGEAADATNLLAVRLFWASVAADPSLLSYSAAGNSAQWQVPLAQAARVVARLRTLQQSCGQVCHTPQHPAGYEASSSSACCAAERGADGASTALPDAPTCCDTYASRSMGEAWQRAGQAELQLCQSGLQQFLEAVSDERPALVYRCIQALDTAVAEYGKSACSQDLVMGRPLGLHVLDLSDRDLARHRGSLCDLKLVMQTEVLRGMSWCLWLLGVF